METKIIYDRNKRQEQQLAINLIKLQNSCEETAKSFTGEKCFS